MKDTHPHDAVTIPVVDRSANPDWKAQITAWAKENAKIQKNVKWLEGWGGSTYQCKTRYGGVYARMAQYRKDNWETPVLCEEYDINGNLIHTEVTNLLHAC